MSVAETVDDDLVRSLRTGVAEELSVTARRISADGRRLEGADEEMLARQLIAQRLEQPRDTRRHELRDVARQGIARIDVHLREQRAQASAAAEVTQLLDGALRPGAVDGAQVQAQERARSRPIRLRTRRRQGPIGPPPPYRWQLHAYSGRPVAPGRGAGHCSITARAGALPLSRFRTPVA